MLRSYNRRIIISSAIAQNSVVRCDFFPISATEFETGINLLCFLRYSQTTFSKQLWQAFLLFIFSVAFVLLVCWKTSQATSSLNSRFLRLNSRLDSRLSFLNPCENRGSSRELRLERDCQLYYFCTVLKNILKTEWCLPIDYFDDMVAILIYIEHSNSYYGIGRGKYIINLPLSIPCLFKQQKSKWLPNRWSRLLGYST